MRAAYDAAVRRSGALTYHPLGRFRARDVIGGNDFTSFPRPESSDFGDFTRIFSGQPAARSAVLTATNNFSLEMWVRPLSHTMGWGLDNNNGGTNGYSFAIIGTTTHTVRAVAQGVAILETTLGSCILGEWSHWVFMRNANVWQYYMNARLMTTGTHSNAPAAPSGATYSALTSSGSPTDFKGLATYTRVLSTDEIRDHYFAGRDNAPLVLIGGATATTRDIEVPFIASTTQVFTQAIDKPVFIVPLALRWSQN